MDPVLQILGSSFSGYWWVWPLTAVAAYLIGSINPAVIITKIATKGKVDIRTVGSGNAGFTNVLRAVGKFPAILTLILDALKCAGAVYFGAFLFSLIPNSQGDPVYSELVVNIGKPIPVQPFMEKYREDEPVALNEMREALREALSPLMHDVRDEEHYDEIMALCKSLNPEYRRREGLRNTAWNRFLMRQKITADYEKGVKVAGYGSKGKPSPWRPLLGVLLAVLRAVSRRGVF